MKADSFAAAISNLQQYNQEVALFGRREARRRWMERSPMIDDVNAEMERVDEDERHAL